MSEAISGLVHCGGCGAPLIEETGLSESLRTPCGECEATVRKYSAHLEVEVKSLTTMTIEGRRAGLSRRKGWFKRIFTGQVAQRSRSNAVADVDRVFDREADRYTETVTLQVTGEIIHQTDEPLSAHRGHGSAKPKT